MTIEAEDSSYDSECDADDSHEQVSRTASDTLGQEFAEYVSQPILHSSVSVMKIQKQSFHNENLIFLHERNRFRAGK